MDPISALALACNVTQLVEQAIEVIVACKKLHQEGSLDENNEIETYADNIAALNKDVKAVLQKNTMPPRGTKLLEIASAASDTAAELKIELNKLKLSKKQGLRGTGLAFKVALRNLYNRRALDRLQKKLEQQDALLQSGLLKRLYADFSLNQSTQQTHYQNLSKGQKDIIAQVLKASESVLTNIDKSVKASEENIVAHFAQDATRQRLLEALTFPEMNERHRMIEDRVSDFDRMYEWLFREHSSGSELDASDTASDDAFQSRNRTETQHDFVKWLQTGSAPFWISGKPGSGKSTLMACIYQNLQEGRIGYGHLKTWAGIKTIRILSFWFFRPASSQLLKSLQGFLRSLCFQVLDVDISLMTKLRENLDGKAPFSLRSFLTSSGVSTRSWTNSELKTWLEYLLEHSEFAYCLIVDGLDEVERPESREHVLEAIQWLSNCSTSIKICCSSRPENPFKRVLEQYRSLRVQDFNSGDIKKACHQRLASTRAARFANEIADRAEGVFLWAHMVAEDLRAAADRGDGDTDMEMRLEESPTEMNDLFMLMLDRMDKFYKKRPGPYLWLVDVATKAQESVSLLVLLLASQDQGDLISRVPGNLDQNFYSQLNKECLSLETNIVARCGGLVEFIRNKGRTGWFPGYFPHMNLFNAYTLKARFIHRSARDFLADSKHAAALLESCNMSKSEAATSLFAASVVSLLMRKFSYTTTRPLNFAMLIEGKDWSASHTLLMDLFFTKLHRKRVAQLHFDRRITSQKLSHEENMVFHYLARFPLAAYFHNRLQRLKIDQVQDAIAISLCLRHRTEFEDDLTDVVMRYIRPKEELRLSYKLGMKLYFLCTCPIWQHFYMSYIEKRLVWLSGPDFWNGSRASIRELISSADVSNIRCWIIRDLDDDYQKFQMIPVPDDPMIATSELFADMEVWSVCISVDLYCAGKEDLKEVLQWSPSRCTHLFDIDDEYKAAFLPHVQGILEEYLPVELSTFDPRAAFLNGKLEFLSLQEKEKIAWYSGREPGFVPKHDPGVYFQAGQFLTANSKQDRDSWEESLYEKSTCQGVEYDAETKAMIKCMLNDDKYHVNKIRERFERKRLKIVSSGGGDIAEEASESGLRGSVDGRDIDIVSG